MIAPSPETARVLHVAIITPTYVELILSGHKTVEARLTRSRRTPFGRVHPGDTIAFKESSGPFRLAARVDRVLSLADLTPARVAALKDQYNDAVLGADEYWHTKASARFATLIWLADIHPIRSGPPFRRAPGSRSAWFELPGVEFDPHSRPADHQRSLFSPPLTT